MLLLVCLSKPPPPRPRDGLDILHRWWRGRFCACPRRPADLVLPIREATTNRPAHQFEEEPRAVKPGGQRRNRSISRSAT